MTGRPYCISVSDAKTKRMHTRDIKLRLCRPVRKWRGACLGVESDGLCEMFSFLSQNILIALVLNLALGGFFF